MIPVMKIRGNIDCWEAIRFSIKIKKTITGDGYEPSTRIYSSGRLKEKYSKMWID